MARYHSAKPAPTPGAVVSDTFEAVAREGARRMLAHALEAEVHVYLGRDRYAPGGADTGYRNGYGRPREIGIGTWSVMVRPPRVSDLPAGAEPFESALLPRPALPQPRDPAPLRAALPRGLEHGRLRARLPAAAGREGTAVGLDDRPP